MISRALIKTSMDIASPACPEDGASKTPNGFLGLCRQDELGKNSVCGTEILDHLPANIFITVTRTSSTLCMTLITAF